jgi:hypothetical protein
MSELDSLLDATLDDLEDLPSFKPFPPGVHRVLASFEQKEINGKPAIELNLVMQETVELASSEDEEPKQGDSCNTMFMLDNEFGRGNLKKCATPFGEALGFSSLRDIVEGVKDVECIAVTAVRKDKNDPDRLYLQVKEIQVV